MAILLRNSFSVQPKCAQACLKTAVLTFGYGHDRLLGEDLYLLIIATNPMCLHNDFQDSMVLARRCYALA